MRVAVVTDSTASLPAELAAQWRLRVVPVQVSIDGHLDDEGRIPHAAVLDALRAGRAVSTEPPAAAAFFWAYQQAAADGADAVVSLHISARQSKTYEHALEAARQSTIPVHVLDSGTSGMSMGYAAAAAARVAAAGGDPERVMATLAKRLDDSSELIYVDTLEYLRKGGRIGAAAKLIGSALSLKPLLTMREGQIAPLDKVLGANRALRRLADTAVRRADGREVDVAVEHVGAPDQAKMLLDEITPRIPRTRVAIITEVSSALAIHLGPGALGITISPA
ncbi:DegV family protein [Alloactinosynnema sp. L-07]|uniref:DegV family protein n=1 Tax=Alloactinosynnema sp. L-07 TaxID=1653480 RepID=UPI0006B5776A|nr:DegV family protein [Alloactinosynnema sp. L-07]